MDPIVQEIFLYSPLVKPYSPTPLLVHLTHTDIAVDGDEPIPHTPDVILQGTFTEHINSGDVVQ